MGRILPILFNTEMVQAILDDRKTATRRVIHQEKYLGVLQSPSRRCSPEIPDEYYIKRLVNPPYEVGDILYVRETFGYDVGGIYIYRASYKENFTGNHDIDAVGNKIKWRPSIHMPKAAARTWLEVTDVKIQRLQEMTLNDFIKEGVLPEGPEECNCAWKHSGCLESSCANREAYLRERYRLPFSHLWDSTIPKEQRDIYGWQANPWVTATEFKKCAKPESEG